MYAQYIISISMNGFNKVPLYTLISTIVYQFPYPPRTVTS